MIVTQHIQIKNKYTLLYNRTVRAMQTGQFARYTKAKKAALWNRLQRYERRLKQWGIAVASAAVLFGMPMTAQGQATFTAQTGSDNPFDNINGTGWVVDGGFSNPTFADLDGDGDMDMLSGEGYYGQYYYYENTGTAQSPTFVRRTGNGGNPLYGKYHYGFSSPTFVDLDGDGDMDVVSGAYLGYFAYYENTGTTVAPAFTERTGGANPLDGFDVGSGPALSAPAFVDIDGDGDMDMFSGSVNDGISFYENTGNATTPAFTERTGAANPFNSVTIPINYQVTHPDFIDVDSDGDMDAVVGNSTGNFMFIQNIGTSSTPSFTHVTGANDPFDGLSASSYSAPGFVDIDGDGDVDMFSGTRISTMLYFKNGVSLPVELLGFEGRATESSHILQWSTATEENNAGFELERSENGSDFQMIGWIAGAGTTQERQDYYYEDRKAPAGVAYYRLKQVDQDGKSEYSKVVTLVRHQATEALHLFPNPVVDHLTISNAQGQATLFNSLGQPVLEFTITHDIHLLNTSELAGGQYVLRIVTQAGEVMTTSFVK